MLTCDYYKFYTSETMYCKANNITCNEIEYCLKYEKDDEID